MSPHVAHGSSHTMLCWQCRMYPAEEEDGRCTGCPVASLPTGVSAVPLMLGERRRFPADPILQRNFSSPATSGTAVTVLLTVVLLIHKSRTLLVAVEWETGAGLDDAAEYGEGQQRHGPMLVLEIVAALEFTLHVAAGIVLELFSRG
ncbi:hypothetical protein GCM10009802_24320 [Streptomyces synnematoformans]|uniref:Uncharacterized protein n=1 Tax=Streptomyces synnematoformans TaxID=415721 RepID=A0ABN2Y2G7_9ACTN